MQLMKFKLRIFRDKVGFGPKSQMFFFLFYKRKRRAAIYRAVTFFGRFAAGLTFNDTPRLAKRNETRLCCRSMHRVYSVANDHRRDGDKQRYRWKRGNWTAAVVLTNDLTPVWTVAFRRDSNYLCWSLSM